MFDGTVRLPPRENPLRGPCDAVQERGVQSCILILQNKDEAGDVVQDVAYRAFPKFRGESVRPWILVIVQPSLHCAWRP